MLAVATAIAFGRAAPAGASVANPTQWVAKVSTEALGRAPTPQAWRSWTGYYRLDRDCNAETLKTLGREAYTSAPFLSLGYDDRAKLVALYRGALDRDPVQSDLGFFLPSLAEERLSWPAVVNAVFESGEFSDLANAICDPASPAYSMSRTASPRAVGSATAVAGSRSQRNLQAALDSAQASCGVVELAHREVVAIGGDQPGLGPDEDPLRVPPCVTLTTVGRPDPAHYADMGRLVPGGLVCGATLCAHTELVRLGDGARLQNVWVDGHGAGERNAKLALVGVQSGQEPTDISQNRLSDPPPDGVAVRAEGYGTTATPCAGRDISQNLITGYGTSHDTSGFGLPLGVAGIAVFCEQARVNDNELVDITDTGIVVHGVWNSATEERRTQRSTVSGNTVVSAGLSARVALGADAVGECLADRDGTPVDCIEFSHDRGSLSAERSFAGTSIAHNRFWTGARTHFDVGLLVGSKAIWGDNGPRARGASFTDNTTAGVDSTRVNTGIAVSGMFDADLRSNSAAYDVVDTNPSVSDAKCPRGEVLYGLGLASFTAGSQPAQGVEGLAGCLADHAPSAGLERIEVGPGRTFVGARSGARFVPWGQNQDLDHRVDGLDLREVKQMGANVVRIHLQFRDIMADCTAADPSALAELGETLRRAEQNGIYLDLTGLSSYAGDDRDPACYRDAGEQERWAAQAAFWRAVAGRAASSPAVFALDIMNEPVVPDRETPCWAGPPPPDRPRAKYCHDPFGGYFFAQNITRARVGRTGGEIGQAWLSRMAAAIRSRDSGHLITLGCLPFTKCVGLSAQSLAGLLDFLSVHIYPRRCTGPPFPDPDPCAAERRLENGARDHLAFERGLVAAYAGGGDPVVVEETFPLHGTPELVRDFILQSRSYATGWLGQWGELTMSQIRADPAGFPWLAYFWGRIFQRLTGNVYGPRPRGDRPDASGGGGAAGQGVRAQGRGAGGAAAQGRGAGGAAAGPIAVADRTAPVLRSLRVTPRRFAVDRRGPAAARTRAPRGAAIRYRLSEQATVVLAIERRSAGRRVRGRCRKATRRRHGARRCPRYRRVGAFRDRGREGRNRIRFSARLTRRTSLRPGRYRIVARAIDNAANRSTRVRAAFRVVARR